MSVAQKMKVDFESTKEAHHKLGRGTNREDIIKSFLETVLPSKYGFGKGEVVTSNNEHSGEMDIIIYDKDKCPKLIYEDGHALFPIEIVYCVIQVKTSLNSTELKSAYKNIESLKKIIPKQGFTHDDNMGMKTGLGAPNIVGLVVAFEASRELKVIADQLKTLDGELDSIKYRPDFIITLDEGIVGPNQRLRSEFNEFNIPNKPEDLYYTRKTKRHTLLRFYMQLLDELNFLKLAPFDLDKYLKMPELIGPYKVSGHDRFMKRNKDGKNSPPKKINYNGIKKIVKYCENIKPKTQTQIFKDWLGAIPMGTHESDYDYEIYEYNPNNLPYLNVRKIQMDENNFPQYNDPAFQGVQIVIDKRIYSVDVNALEESDFDEREDFDYDEFFAE
ncbi:hypothetical protein BMS_0799 [Halobacteriovorax marinus SJ]|uniref:DUF6602 domain-containing protein n=2 Tax=Halobacteriovorax marinus TaxID=97084 RepID=E1X5Y1_HALMS|nr:hypothetical protein BMS_0799 [Halobacteriovorax marinus SJ]